MQLTVKRYPNNVAITHAKYTKRNTHNMFNILVINQNFAQTKRVLSVFLKRETKQTPNAQLLKKMRTWNKLFKDRHCFKLRSPFYHSTILTYVSKGQGFFPKQKALMNKHRRRDKSHSSTLFLLGHNKTQPTFLHQMLNHKGIVKKCQYK